MDALLTLLMYLAPFLAVGIAARVWMRRKAKLSEVQAEGDPQREQPRFLLGICAASSWSGLRPRLSISAEVPLDGELDRRSRRTTSSQARAAGVCRPAT
jgi:hypothetical protein